MRNINFVIQVYKKKELKIKNCLMFCMVARTVCIDIGLWMKQSIIQIGSPCTLNVNVAQFKSIWWIPSTHRVFYAYLLFMIFVFPSVHLEWLISEINPLLFGGIPRRKFMVWKNLDNHTIPQCNVQTHWCIL